ncbi:hypothetical protein BH11PSE10_BH11PSE10_14870 [soil metagenome]
MALIPRKQLLLVDPHSLFRRTVAAVARELNLADVHEASSHDAARQLLHSQHFDALMLDIGESVSALAIVQDVRSGGTGSAAAMPIAMTAESCDLATLTLFKQLQVRRIMLKPFKVKTVLEVVSELVAR